MGKPAFDNLLASPDDRPQNSAKRKKPDEQLPEPIAALRKKARNRASFSCGECHRRKQKCDRQVPCSHCVARKVPELCKAYTPGKTEQDFHMRLTRLEQIVERALPQYANPSGSIGSDEIRDLSPSSDANEPEDDEGSDGRLLSGTWHGVSAIGSLSSAPILEQLQNVIPQQAKPGDLQPKQSPSHLARLSSCSKDLALAAEHLNAARAGDPASLLAASKIIDAVRQITDPDSGATFSSSGTVTISLPPLLEQTGTAADNFRSLIQDCGVSPHKVSEILQDLPTKKSTDALVDFYFSTVNYTRYPLNEQEFRASYDAVQATDGIGINPNDITFLPLLFIVLAIAVRVAPESLTGDEKQRRLTSLRYYWSSRRALLFAAAIHNDSIELVWVRLLSARFLTFDRRITECWSQLGAAIRTAQALGLHRDGKKMGFDAVQTQTRRRLWAYIYHADRSFALVMGRPHSIMDDYTSAHRPLNIDDEELLANPANPTDYPLSHITPVTFVILRHQLASIIGRICHHFQQVRHKSHYSEVITLEEDLMRFSNELPVYFSLNPDTSLDATHTYLPVHRFLILTEIMFVRMSLHRPYLLRRLDTDRFAKSRYACFDAARTDFTLRTQFRATMPADSLPGVGIAYREFQTAMISGIALMLDPRGPDSQDMRIIVDTFLSDHSTGADLDETTKREVKIIEFLKSKSQDSRQGSDSGASPGSTHATLDYAHDVKMEDSANGSENTQVVKAHKTGPPLSSMRLTPLPGMSGHPSHPTTTTGAAHFSPVPAPLATHSMSHIGSPPSSASPGDDTAGPQSLIDHWYDVVSNAPPADLFSSLGSTPYQTPWNEFPPGNFNATASPLPVLGQGSQVNGSQPLDMDDLSYWETMFNMIPSGPQTGMKVVS